MPDRFGWATIFLARFVPIVRTVATVLAGVSKMRFSSYVLATVAGGIVWADGVLLLGYGLGHIDFVREHKGWIDWLVILAVVLSLVPTLIHYLRGRRKDDASKADTSKADTSKVDTSKLDAPKIDAPKLDAAKKDDATAP